MTSPADNSLGLEWHGIEAKPAPKGGAGDLILTHPQLFPNGLYLTYEAIRELRHMSLDQLHAWDQSSRKTPVKSTT